MAEVSPWVEKFRSVSRGLNKDSFENPNELRKLLEEIHTAASEIRKECNFEDISLAAEDVEHSVEAILSDYGEFVLSGGEELWQAFLNSVSRLNSLIDGAFPREKVSHIWDLLRDYSPAGFTENWAVAVVHLTAVEIAMNMRRQSLRRKGAPVDDFKVILVGGQRVSVPKKFHERLEETFHWMMVYEGVQVEGLLRILPEPFWKLRNRVVHSGYSPRDDELELVVTWSRKLVDLFVP